MEPKLPLSPTFTRSYTLFCIIIGSFQVQSSILLPYIYTEAIVPRDVFQIGFSVREILEKRILGAVK